MVLWVTAGVAFILGATLSILGCYFLTDTGQKNRKLMRKLNTIENEFHTHQQRVTDHFDTSATLLNQLTSTYKDIHNHMASSAEMLCQDHHIKEKLDTVLLGSSTILSGGGTNGTLRRNYPTPSQQPRDYAPKKIPNEIGMLSEEFNINKAGNHSTITNPNINKQTTLEE